MTKEQMDTSKNIKTRIILAFGLVGFLVDFNFFTLQSAAQDILEATNIPTAWVSLAIAGPAGLVSALYPYVFERVPDSVACFVIFIASVAGILLTSLVQDLRVRLAGACLVSFGIGSTESIFISLSSFYGGNAITSYGLGTAISFVAGPLSYAGMTMLACWSPNSSLLLLSVLWILLPISYLLIKDWSNCSHNPTSYKEVRYISVESDSNQEPSGSKLSRKDMLFLTWKIQKLFIPLLVGMFCKNLLLSGVVTTIAFTNIPITPRNQYLLYTLAYGTGELLSRPYLGYLSLCAIEDKFVFKKTWIPALLQVFVTMFMVFDSWFRLIPELYLALALVTLNNFLLGILYVNSFLNAGEGLRAEEKRFCRAFLAGALWSSNIAASLISLNTEPRLRQHCLLFYSEVACYTRSQTAWSRNISCVL